MCHLHLNYIVVTGVAVGRFTMSGYPHAESLRELVEALHGVARVGASAHPSSIDTMRIVQAYINAHIDACVPIAGRISRETARSIWW